jgi:flagellar basal body P-ring formation protein FlgA
MLRRVLLALVLAAPSAALAGETVLTPTRVIYPGETLGADAVEAVELKRALPPKGPVATAAAQVTGKVATRTLLPGKLIPVNALRAAYLIQQGAPVQAVFAAGSLSISVTAVPLEPGAAGDFVRLRNPDSGKVFSGTVMADGTVRVSGE